ncbi:hypothetical protein HNY73_011282 [Argiope bruennichi]|uniref:Uncharacterized protein n=1 Tax=Argiope bruennichi TaxID=94029 RepID=A0A8T0F3M9_ARGBR|nr:hypothetical protein HNY73_011282 [Argiope bruennichi]
MERDEILEKAVLDAVDKRFRHGSGLFETKRDYHVTILRQVADILNLPIPCQQDDRLQKLFGKYFHPSDAPHLLDVYVRQNCIGKEKLIKTRDVFIVLGVDGFEGLVHLKPYLNASYSPRIYSSLHFKAVQNMYHAIETMTISSLTGTDSACVVFLSLLKLFRGSICDNQILIIMDQFFNKVESFMHRHAQYYQDVRLVNDDVLNQLARIYIETNPDWHEDAIQRTNLLLKLKPNQVIG